MWKALQTFRFRFKDSLLTGRKLWPNQAQGGAAKWQVGGWRQREESETGQKPQYYWWMVPGSQLKWPKVVLPGFSGLKLHPIKMLQQWNKTVSTLKWNQLLMREKIDTTQIKRSWAASYTMAAGHTWPAASLHLAQQWMQETHRLDEWFPKSGLWYGHKWARKE